MVIYGPPLFLEPARLSGKPVHVIEQDKNAELLIGRSQKVRQRLRSYFDSRSTITKKLEKFALDVIRATVRVIASVDVYPPEVIVTHRNGCKSFFDTLLNERTHLRMIVQLYLPDLFRRN